MHNYADLRTIAEKAAFLYERIGARFTTGVLTEAESAEAEQRTAEWCKQAARGDKAYFETRLSWDGLDLNAARQLAGKAVLRDSEPLPSWTEYLAPVISKAGELRASTLAQMQDDSARFPFLKAAEPIAFEHILAPFVECATERLMRGKRQHLELLSPGAQADFQRHLLKTLSWVSRKTLHLEFSVWHRMPDLEFLPPRGSPDGERKLYSSFVKRMWTDGLTRLFGEYPVLARFMARTCELWVMYTAEFLSHLAEDHVELEKRCNQGRGLGKVEGIHAGLSDRHNLGKSALGVTFQSGTVCFYKPRNCKADLDFNNLLEWLNCSPSPLHFRTYGMLHRGHHGWAENVLQQTCGSEAEVQRYFQRAGMLMALLYALQASDCNYENIIPHGEFPVLIDAETLLQPRPGDFDSDPWGALELANRTMYYDSVFRLGILPRWIARSDGHKINLSGLGSSVGRGCIQKQVWSHINTDRMAVNWECIVADQGSMGPSLGGRLVNAADYLEEIITGFERMFRLLIARHEDLWGEKGPLGEIGGFGTRFVFRNTFTYASVQDQCLAPKNLRDGMDTSICVEVLARRYAHFVDGTPTAWPVTAFEHASLLDLDIPRFEAPTDTNALQIGPGTYIQSYFIEPGVATLKKRFATLSEDDLDLQKRFIRCAFAHFENPQRSLETKEDVRPAVEVQTSSFLNQAISIARGIREKSIRTTDGTVAWITQAYNMDSQFWRIQPMGLYLYDGICGVGLFLAALERTTGTTEFRDLIAGVLKVLDLYSSDRLRDFLERESVGAGLGTASLVYSLARMGTLLDDGRIVDSAIQFAKLITRTQIDADRRLDTIGGAAGCLAVFCTLYRLAPQPWMLERAVECGQHLLSTRRKTPTGHQSWATVGGKFLCGFSHGAAGMIYALSQLYELTGDERYRRAAREAHQYEESLFDESEKNWPNLLLPGKDRGFDFWNSWCHGAPGIGLARLGSSGSLEAAVLNRDLDRALKASEKLELHHSDFICCGNLGRIEVLVEASHKLGRPEHLQRAREIGAHVVHRAGQNGRYGVGVKNGIYIPSFYQGMAGVGYQLLRLARPDLLPSALSWR